MQDPETAPQLTQEHGLSEQELRDIRVMQAASQHLRTLRDLPRQNIDLHERTHWVNPDAPPAQRTLIPSPPATDEEILRAARVNESLQPPIDCTESTATDYELPR